MDIVSILSFLKYFVPEKSITTFTFEGTDKNWKFLLCMENKTKKKEIIKRIEINGSEINSLEGIMEKRDFPLTLNPLSKICWKFYLTKDNSNERPEIILVHSKGWKGTRKKEYSI